MTEIVRLLWRARAVIDQVARETIQSIRRGGDTDEQVLAYKKGVDYDEIDHPTILEARRWTKLVAGIDEALLKAEPAAEMSRRVNRDWQSKRLAAVERSAKPE